MFDHMIKSKLDLLKPNIQSRVERNQSQQNAHHTNMLKIVNLVWATIGIFLVLQIGNQESSLNCLGL